MNETTEIVLGTLNKDDVKALQQADSICFQRYADGTGNIRGNKVNRKRGPYEDYEKTYTIKCQHVVSGKGVPYGAPGIKCFEMIGNYTDSTIQTVVNLLKVGDIITIRWHADGNNNGYVDQSRVTEVSEHTGSQYVGEKLHADILYIEVKRKDKKMVFMLDVSICVANSARMIQV